MVGASRRRFERDGLSYWSVRDAEGGPVIGRGGCMGPDELVAALAEQSMGPEGLLV